MTKLLALMLACLALGLVACGGDDDDDAGGGGGGGGAIPLATLIAICALLARARLSYATAFSAWLPFAKSVVSSRQFQGDAPSAFSGTPSMKNSTRAAPFAIASHAGPVRFPDTVAPESGALNATEPACVGVERAASANTAMPSSARISFRDIGESPRVPVYGTPSSGVSATAAALVPRTTRSWTIELACPLATW